MEKLLLEIADKGFMPLANPGGKVHQVKTEWKVSSALTEDANIEAKDFTTLESLKDSASPGPIRKAFNERMVVPCMVKDCDAKATYSGWGPDQGGSMTSYYMCDKGHRFPSPYIEDLMD